jgi:hypothetical protein
MPAFLARLRRGEGFLSRAAALADGLLRGACAEFSVGCGPDWMELRPVDEADLTISCGAPSETPAVELGPALREAMRGASAAAGVGA